MDKKLVLISLLSLLLVTLIVFFLNDFIATHSKVSCSILVVFVILLVALWAVPILGIDIESKLISVKNSVSQVEQQNKILTKQSELIVKATYVLTHGAGCYGGPNEFHQDRLSHIFQELLPISSFSDVKKFEKEFSESYETWLSTKQKT